MNIEDTIKRLEMNLELSEKYMIELKKENEDMKRMIEKLYLKLRKDGD